MTCQAFWTRSQRLHYLFARPGKKKFERANKLTRLRRGQRNGRNGLKINANISRSFGVLRNRRKFVPREQLKGDLRKNKLQAENAMLAIAFPDNLGETLRSLCSMYYRISGVLNI